MSDPGSSEPSRVIRPAPQAGVPQAAPAQPGGAADGSPSPGAAGAPAPTAGDGGEDGRAPESADWPAWTALVALVGGLILAAFAGLVVDIPALALGVHVSSSHTPGGLAIADTFVQDVAFVVAAVYCARIGGRVVRPSQFGLSAPRSGWLRAWGMIGLLLLAFLILSVAWSQAVNPSREKLLEQLGTNEGTALLVLSAALTCVVAPVCEELLFRGYIFRALSNWRGMLPAALITGVLFGAVHVGSAPALDLVPLAMLGTGLCLLYRYSGSLYPCIVAHALNNCLAFGSLEKWSGAGFVALIAGSLAMLWLAKRALERLLADRPHGLGRIAT